MALSVHKNFNGVYKSERTQDCCSVSYSTYRVPCEEREARRAKNDIAQTMRRAMWQIKDEREGTEGRDYSYSLETLSHLPQLSALLQVASPNTHLPCQCPPLFLQPLQYIMRNSVMPGWLPELMSRLHNSQWPLGTVEFTQIVCVFSHEQYYLQTEQNICLPHM